MARLTFDETVSAAAGGVQMYDARGKVVESKASARDTVLTVDVPDTLDEGTYVVSWRVVSADGHPVAGALTFSVGRPSAVVRHPPTPDESSASGVRGALSAVQAIGYLGLFLAAGLVVFAGWLLPALPRLDVLRRRLRRIARAAASVAALAALVQLPLSGAYQQGLGFAGLLEASAWSGAGGRDLLALAMLVGGLALAVAPLGAAPLVGRARSIATAGAVVAIASPSVVGHSRAYPPQLLVVATDVLHVAVGAVWLGGLAGLALSLPALAGQVPRGGGDAGSLLRPGRRPAHPAGRQRFAAGLADHRLVGRPVRHDVRSPADREGDDRCAGRRDRGLEPVRVAASHHRRR